MIRKEEFDKILRDFVKETNARVFIFGSRARGDAKPDIDLAIMFEKETEDNKHKLSLLREKFENSNIPQKVEIVDLREIGEDFKEEIMKDAVLWKEDY